MEIHKFNLTKLAGKVLVRNIFMNKLSALLLWSFAASLDQSPFDGTWVIDSNAQLPKEPIIFILDKGMFRCSGCTANVAIKADGARPSSGGDELLGHHSSSNSGCPHD